MIPTARASLVTVSACVAAVLGGACAGGSTDDCAPPPATDLAVTLHGSNATDHVGKPAAMRLVLGSSSTMMVFSCTTAMVAADGTFTLEGGAFGPIAGLRAELILSSDESAAFAGDADRHFTFRLGEDGTTTGDRCDVDHTWTLMIDPPTTDESPVSWSPGVACPGE